jgi:hypothetical protein
LTAGKLSGQRWSGFDCRQATSRARHSAKYLLQQ